LIVAIEIDRDIVGVVVTHGSVELEYEVGPIAVKSAVAGSVIASGILRIERIRGLVSVERPIRAQGETGVWLRDSSYRLISVVYRQRGGLCGDREGKAGTYQSEDIAGPRCSATDGLN
jgi:hypothetical protein